MNEDTQSVAGDPRLVALIHAAIDAAGGTISFAEFMDMALFAPGLGYYDADAARFGVDGDFVTAPESSPQFSRCVARQVGEVLAALGDGDVCEVGAGSGILAADLLESLTAIDSPPRRYFIVERSPALRRRQRDLFEARGARVAARVEWRDTLPSGMRGVILGNEVLDALPAHRFRLRDGGLRECRVARQGDGFRWVESDGVASPLAAHAERVLASLGRTLPDGYVSELAPAREELIGRVATCLEVGVALFFDYGYGRDEYYHPQRSSGTLRCFHRHRAHDDPLILVGCQDISVHVDFTTIAEAATEAGLVVAGFTTQAEFLLATGLLDACRDVDPQSRGYAELTAQIKQLTLPSQMGEAIKVMALTRNFEEDLTGFTGRDLRGRL